MSWHQARRQYESTHCGVAARMAAIAFDDFERLCGSPEISEVPRMVDGFVEALRLEGVDRESLAIYREAVDRLAAFTTSRERIAA